MMSETPGYKSMDETSTDSRPVSFECTPSAGLVALRSSAQLPLDFLEKRWVRIFRKIFGPINPGLLIFGVVFLSLFIWLVCEFLSWVFAQPPLLAMCISAFGAATASLLVSPDYRVPDIRLPLEEIKRDFELRDTVFAIFFLATLVLFLAMGTLFYGVAGFAVVLAFFGIGVFATFPYLSLTSQIHLCACCARPAIFRKFRGRWTCIVCGNPR